MAMQIPRRETIETKLIWITPDADKLVGYMARVSNPHAKPDDPVSKLIRYLFGHKHWSPFEMACMCVEINTTRDIARQILRHDFHFQEFSQRYAEVDEQPEFSGAARLQDTKNRQNSLECDSPEINDSWVSCQNRVWDVCWTAYKACLKVGIAKELARKLLPEGLTRTKLYMQGTIRNWIHYLEVRCGPETQAEHRYIAQSIRELLYEHCHDISSAVWPERAALSSGEPGSDIETSQGRGEQN